VSTRIYLAGGLFNAGERFHNLVLEKYLRTFGYDVVLPQREAQKFQKGDSFDVAAIVADCQRSCTDRNIVFVGCIDGADADSGTCAEYGMALAVTHRAIVYRTDFRTAVEKEVGVNAMLRAPGTIFVYEPCFATELDQMDAFYLRLAQALDRAIRALQP
jgi:nucleoside 2-deoxyribosyltransferase